MECQEVREMLNAWVDHELPPEQAVRMEGHIARCSACRAESEVLRQMVDVLDTMSPVRVPGTLARKTLRKFRQDFESPGIIDWWRNLGPVMRGASCAAVAAGLLLGLGLGIGLTRLQASDAAIRLIDVIYYTGGILS